MGAERFASYLGSAIDKMTLDDQQEGDDLPAGLQILSDHDEVGG